MELSSRGSLHPINRIARSSTGCWTCKLRRKKCDERYPTCGVCSALHITCHGYDPTKPQWMDGGALQDEMAESLKRTIKESNRAYGRRWGEHNLDQDSEDSALPIPSHELRSGLDETQDYQNLGYSTSGLELRAQSTTPSGKRETGGAVTHCKSVPERVPLSRSDNILLVFYLEHLLPFLFPFYRPSLIEGSRAWLLEMMTSSPVMRRAILCQSVYFFTLLVLGREPEWETMLGQTNEAFGMLREALQVINRVRVADHLHGAVRTLASIMQVQRFAISLAWFEHCHSHHNAALALFMQILDNADADERSVESYSSVSRVMSLLGPPTSLLQAPSIQIPSPKQLAFRFSSSLLLLDDVLASIGRREQPRLYRYHGYLLSSDTDQAIRLEEVIGCQSFVITELGEAAALDSWKKQHKEVGDLDVMELVHRATKIKHALEGGLTSLEHMPADNGKAQGLRLSEIITTLYLEESRTACAYDSPQITRIWAHAALIYLSIIVSGWQSTNPTIRYHVARIMELTSDGKFPAVLLRTIVWPLCVAGCLATREQEVFWRTLLIEVQPASAFATLKKALQLMEDVWSSRDLPGDSTDRDLAACLGGRHELVLLV